MNSVAISTHGLMGGQVGVALPGCRVRVDRLSVSLGIVLLSS